MLSSQSYSIRVSCFEMCVVSRQAWRFTKKGLRDQIFDNDFILTKNMPVFKHGLLDSVLAILWGGLFVGSELLFREIEQ
jgi:E3 ubiquitin-protein ligase DOA10